VVQEREPNTTMIDGDTDATRQRESTPNITNHDQRDSNNFNWWSAIPSVPRALEVGLNLSMRRLFDKPSNGSRVAVRHTES
jgi:hypothetical protein